MMMMTIINTMITTTTTGGTIKRSSCGSGAFNVVVVDDDAMGVRVVVVSDIVVAKSINMKQINFLTLLLVLEMVIKGVGFSPLCHSCPLNLLK